MPGGHSRSRSAAPLAPAAPPAPEPRSGSRLPGQGALAGARQPPQQHQPPSVPRGPQAQRPQGPQQPLLRGAGGRGRSGIGGPEQPLRSPAPAPGPPATPAPPPSAPAGGAGRDPASLHVPAAQTLPRETESGGSGDTGKDGRVRPHSQSLSYGTRHRLGTLARDTISSYLKSGLFPSFSKAAA